MDDTLRQYYDLDGELFYHTLIKALKQLFIIIMREKMYKPTTTLELICSA